MAAITDAAELQKQLFADIAGFTHNPTGFVKYVYPWGEKELVDSAGPRPWQGEVLSHIGSHLQNPETRYQPCCIAVSSGHGIGKSASIGMVIDWALSTCEDCKVIVTAGTGTQLSTKTVPEVSTWFRRSINAEWWDVKAQSITVRSAKHEKTWRTDFITWNEQNTEAFAGLHNKGKRILLVFDEASAIADKVWEVAEGALTDEGTEIIWLAFGNPTRNTGRFRECFGSRSHRWKTYQIDSRTVDGTNKEQIEKWRQDYGEDSDWFRVRVRGEFPRAGSTQFIPGDIVEAARHYQAVGYERLPKIMSADVARFGDDQTVIGYRQGRFSAILGKYRGLDSVQVALRVIEFMGSEKPDAVVIDEDGVGGPVLDQIRFRGYTKGLYGFHGGAAAHSNKYFNRIAEMWGETRDWLKGGAQIPNDPELADQLTSREYGFANGKVNFGSIKLESKDDMKTRGLASPDCADMLAMTFSVNVAAPKPQAARPKQTFSTWS